MNKVKKLKSLRPGERKILKALTDSPKSYSEIAEALKWTYKDAKGKTKIQNPTLLSDYLKRLQKLGLVSRDIDSRKYSAEKISIEKLFYNDVFDFLRKGIAHDLEAKTAKEKTVIPSALWFTVIEHDCATEFKIKIKELLKQPEINIALNLFFHKTNVLWEKYVLSQRGKKEQEIIIRYKQELLEAYKLICKTPSLQDCADLFSLSAEERLRRDYPSIKNIPKEFVAVETERLIQSFKCAMDDIDQPRDLADLEKRLNLAERRGKIKKDFSEEEKKKIEKIIEFLENKKNKRIYEGFLKSFDNDPKVLFVLPLLGFRGYLDQLKELYPEKFSEIEKQMFEKMKKARDVLGA